MATHSSEYPLIFVHRPSTFHILKNIEEVTDVWLEQHGGLFLKRIAEFCANNGDVEMDIEPVHTKLAVEKLVRLCSSCYTVSVLCGMCRSHAGL